MGEVLSIDDAGESPDFVRVRRSGALVGAEFTEVLRDPETAWGSVFSERREHMECDEALERVALMIEKKSGKKGPARDGPQA
jgi:hypothetical protein